VLAGLTAHAKGVRLGIFEPGSAEEVRERREGLPQGERLEVGLMGCVIPVVRTANGIRAVAKGKLVEPASVEQYLESKLGADLGGGAGGMPAGRLAAALARRPPSRSARREGEARGRERGPGPAR
jgi:hypothetical protein